MRLALGASTKEVRASYRVLSKELHPDNAKVGGPFDMTSDKATRVAPMPVPLLPPTRPRRRVAITRASSVQPCA